MKVRFFRFAAALLVGAALLATGCTADYGSDIQALNKRLDELTTGKVATLESQVQGLLSTVTTLETAAKHDEDIKKIGKDITDLETALKADYEKKIKDAVDALNTAIDKKLDKTTFDSAKEKIESGMQGLSDRIKAIEDADFQKQINDLNDALGTRLGKLEALLAGDWDGKTVKQAIDAVAKSVADLESAISGEIGLLKSRMDAAEAAIKKINEETIPAINKAISDLQSLKLDKSEFDAYKKATGTTIGLMQSAINSLTALTAGFPEGKTIKEYIDGILVKFDDYVLKTTFDEFVKIAATKEELNAINSQLDGRLDALEALLAGDWGGVTVRKYIENQISATQAQLDQITNAEGTGRLDVLEEAAAEYFETVEKILSQIKFAENYEGESGKGLQGYIDDGDAKALKAAKDYTDSQILLVKNLIAEITNEAGTGRLDVLEEVVAELVGRIQSIVLVPAFDDGKMTVTGNGTVVNTFKIMPADAVKDVVALFSSNPGVFSFDVKTVQTRADAGNATLTLSVTDVQLNTANADKGWVDVSVGSNFKGLSEADKAKTYSAALVIDAISSPFYTICLGSASSIDGHEYVDMGTVVINGVEQDMKWATCNVGAESPEEYGSLFAWGETAPKEIYLWDTYAFGNDGPFTHYTGDDDNTLRPQDDAATVNWGAGWRTPTDDECRALTNNQIFKWEWTSVNGVNGILVTRLDGPCAGNNIFFPAVGCESTDDYGAGTKGYYWSSTLYPDVNDYSADAYTMCFNSGYFYIGLFLRCDGLPVRPVCTK